MSSAQTLPSIPISLEDCLSYVARAITDNAEDCPTEVTALVPTIMGALKRHREARPQLALVTDEPFPSEHDWDNTAA